MSIQLYQLEPEYSSNEEAEEKPWIQGKKKFRNFNLLALKVNGQILLGVFVKDEQSCQVKLNVCTAKNSLFCQSWWKVCYFTLDIFSKLTFNFLFRWRARNYKSPCCVCKTRLVV